MAASRMDAGEQPIRVVDQQGGRNASHAAHNRTGQRRGYLVALLVKGYHMLLRGTKYAKLGWQGGAETFSVSRTKVTRVRPPRKPHF